MDFSYMLNTYLLKKESLSDMGFEKKSVDGKMSYILKKELDEENLYAMIRVSENSIDVQVYDCDTHERYALVDMENVSGSFVGQVREKIYNIIEEIKSKAFVTVDLKARYVDFLEKEFGAKPEYPWEGDSESGVFRCGNKKWFALVMNIPLDRLKIKSDEKVWVVNLKVASEKIPSLVDGKSIFPAWHMNKKYWITVLLSSVTNWNLLCDLTKESYSLVG